MDHPVPFRPEQHAVFRAEKMGKSTLFESDRALVGINAFEPGQEHALHTHDDMDKVYYVLEGRGALLLPGREERLEPGLVSVAPAGAPHGIRNDGESGLVVLVVLARG